MSKKILIVEDNIDAANSFGKLLKKMGQKVSIVYSGKDALSEAQNFEPDLFFIDIAIPDINGLEVAKILRKNPKFSNTSMVALTGYGQEVFKEGVKTEFDYHLLKPVGIKEIREILSN